MKYIALVIGIFLHTQMLFAQEATTSNKQGDFYVYWGYNRCWFTNSNINFSGQDYDFTLLDVVGKDRQTSFTIKGYFAPSNITIPQYNFRIGYFIKKNYSISIGTDHMKYVVQNKQTVPLDGVINVPNSEYNGTYDKEDFYLSSDFLQLEYTDGLNYGNIDFRRYDQLFISNNFSINVTEGIGAGILIPKTNASLLGNERHDKFRLAGYGFSGVVAINVLYKFLFIQSELKGGFINMPTIRTTKFKADTASQHFFFSQFNVVLGTQFNL